MKPRDRHRNHVPRVQGPFVAPQGLGALPIDELPQPIVGEVSLNGTMHGGSSAAPSLVVAWSLAVVDEGLSITGVPVYPDATLFPSAGVFPGSQGAELLVEYDDQFGRPVADLLAGGWTATPLWSKLDEVAVDDADFVTGVAV